MSVDVLESLPEAFYEVSASGILEVFPKPTIIHLSGVKKKPLFLGVLLHGNEHTSLIAFQNTMRKYRDLDRALPRSLVVFVGNPSATSQNLRRLETQTDLNRIWSESFTGPERGIADSVKEIIRSVQPFAIVDVHNNTGKNPHYACVARKTPECIHLGNLFSKTVVYAQEPGTSLFVSLADEFPTVVLECGVSGEEVGIKQAESMIDACMHADHLPKSFPPESDVSLYETVGRITVDASASISSSDSATDSELTLSRSIEKYNFSSLDVGTVLGWAKNRSSIINVEAYRPSVEEAIYVRSDGCIVNRVPVIPAMLTLNLKVVKQDCLGYLMEKIRISGPNLNMRTET